MFGVRVTAFGPSSVGTPGTVFPRVSAAAMARAAAGLLMAPVHLSAPWGRGKTRLVLCPLTGTAGDVPLLVLHVVPGLVTLLKLLVASIGLVFVFFAYSCFIFIFYYFCKDFFL